MPRTSFEQKRWPKPIMGNKGGEGGSELKAVEAIAQPPSSSSVPTLSYSTSPTLDLKSAVPYVASNGKAKLPIYHHQPVPP